MRSVRGLVRIVLAAVPAVALLVGSAAPVAAAPGDLDSTFGAGGTVITEFPSSYSGAHAVALQQDGKIVAAGFAHTNNSILSDLAVVRYTSGGGLDAAFGTGGLVRVDVGGRFDEAHAIVVQPDGKIVVAGASSDAGGYDMVVVRLNGDGSLDTSFDGDGIVLVDLGSESSARAVALQQDGRILLAGWAMVAVGGGCCSSDFAVARLTTVGQLDVSFDGDGRLTTDFLPGTDDGYDAAQALLVQPDGRIVVGGGAVSNAVSVDFAVARYLTDGSLDPTFSNDGLLTTDFLGYYDEVRALAVDNAGRIVAGGQSCEFPGNSDEVCDFGLTRYTAGGVLDRKFGQHGTVRTDLGSDVNEGVKGLAVQPDGRIGAAGQARGIGGQDVGLARYRADGRLDRTFGTHGLVITPVSPSTDEVGGLALQPDGRILVAGTAAVNLSFGFFVSRYLGT
jgi:uncharacterized delta-60 repeat protein